MLFQSTVLSVTLICYNVASVCLSSVTYVLWLNGASYMTAYRKSYVRNRFIWYQDEWPWPLSRGHIKVTYVNHCLTFAIEYLGKDHQ